MRKDIEVWMDINVQDCNGLHLGNLGPTFFKIMTNGLNKGWFFFSQNHFVCDVTIILPVKETHITIFEV